MSTLFLMYFLGLVSLQIGVSMLTGVFMMLVCILTIMNYADLIDSFSTGEYVLVGMTSLLLVTWIIAFIGAYYESKKIITYALICWTIFVLIWIQLVAYDLMTHNPIFCVANGSRCPPTMWLINSSNTHKITEDVDAAIDVDDEDYNDSNETQPTTIKYKNMVMDCYFDDKNYTEEAQQPAVKSKNISSKFATSDIINNTFTTHTVHCKVMKKLSIKNRVAVSTKNSDVSTRRPAVSTRSPAVSTRRPAVSTRRPAVSTRRPAVSTRRPAVSTRRPAMSTKRLVVSTKENNQLVSSLQHTSTANEVLRAAYNHSKYVVPLIYFLLLFLYSWYNLISYYVELHHVAQCTCRQNDETQV